LLLSLQASAGMNHHTGLLQKAIHLRSKLSFKPAVSVVFAGFQNRDICLLWAFPMSRFGLARPYYGHKQVAFSDAYSSVNKKV